MVQFVFFLQATQDRYRVLYGRLVDIDRLEAPLECRILLDIFLVFVERSSADHVQLAARQRRLQEVRGVHAAFAGARANQRVHLVDEQDDLPIGIFHLVDHGLQAFLEFAAIFRTRNQRAHVKRHQRAALEAVGHIAIGDAQRQPLGDRGLAHAGITDKNGIVLGPAGQNLDCATNLLVAADHRVELAVARRLGQVAGVFLERIVALFCACAICGATAGHFLNHRLERLRIHAGSLQSLACVGAAGKGHGLQYALYRNEAVAGLLCQLFGLIEQASRIIV